MYSTVQLVDWPYTCTVCTVQFVGIWSSADKIKPMLWMKQSTGQFSSSSEEKVAGGVQGSRQQGEAEQHLSERTL